MRSSVQLPLNCGPGGLIDDCRDFYRDSLLVPLSVKCGAAQHATDGIWPPATTKPSLHTTSIEISGERTACASLKAATIEFSYILSAHFVDLELASGTVPNQPIRQMSATDVSSVGCDAFLASAGPRDEFASLLCGEECPQDEVHLAEFITRIHDLLIAIHKHRPRVACQGEDSEALRRILGPCTEAAIQIPEPQLFEPERCQIEESLALGRVVQGDRSGDGECFDALDSSTWAPFRESIQGPTLIFGGVLFLLGAARHADQLHVAWSVRITALCRGSLGLASHGRFLSTSRRRAPASSNASVDSMGSKCAR